VLRRGSPDGLAWDSYELRARGDRHQEENDQQHDRPPIAAWIGANAAQRLLDEDLSPRVDFLHSLCPGPWGSSVGDYAWAALPASAAWTRRQRVRIGEHETDVRGVGDDLPPSTA
jgi:hypothetical protein